MKIGILTLPLKANYGGILQNYALQETLRRLGHVPITIRIGKRTWAEWACSRFKNLIKWCLRKNARWEETPTYQKNRLQGMERFIQTYITTTPTKKWYSCKMLSCNAIEVLIVGSDQVWRPRYNKPIEDLFLRFAQSKKLLKVSYAASFGTSEWEYTEKQTQTCKKLVKDFHAISVREEDGITLCKKHLNRDADWVLDPTLLLNRQDYEYLCSEEPIKGNFVYAYILDTTKEKCEFCENIAKNKNLPIQFAFAHEELSKNDCPERWLAAFRDASFIVTDSFHGTIFSLIFGKDFFTLSNHKRGNTRFESLAKQFNISHRILSTTNINISSIDSIDWNLINTNLGKWKIKSLKFLQDNLNINE